METNTNSKILAGLLASGKHGTFSSLIIRKKGDTRKGILYGNDQVYVTVITGFSYPNLVNRSLVIAEKLDPAALCARLGNPQVTVEDFQLAKAELLESLRLSSEGENVSTTDGVYESLQVNGESVQGARVYKCTGLESCKCRDCTGDPRAPKGGTIYLQGLKIAQRVLDPAPNGPVPAPNSKPKTIAKNEMRKLLPVSRYVSYSLEAGTDFILKVGGVAMLESEQRGYVVSDDVLNLFA
jgi:hypothetical protein